MRTNLPQSRWIVAVPAVAVAAAYLFCSFLPGQQAIDGLRQELSAAEEFVDQVEAFGPATEITRQECERTQTYVRAWQESAPSEEELSELFGRINLLAKASGTTTTRFDPQPPVLYDEIRQTPVLFACVGSFGQVCGLLQELERLEETVWVEELRMESSGENGKNVQCDLTLAIFADNPENSGQVDQSG